MPHQIDQIQPTIKPAKMSCKIPTMAVVTWHLDPMSALMIVPIPGKKMFTMRRTMPQGALTLTMSLVRGRHMEFIKKILKY